MDKFNIYKEGLDLQFAMDACMQRGRIWHMKKGEVFELVGEPARWMGFIKTGYLKYVAHNEVDGKDYSMAFVFEGELAGDYPFCFYGGLSDVSIVAGEDCTLYVMEGAEFNLLFEESIDTMRAGKQFAEHLFIQAYTRVLNFYRTDAKTRYIGLLQRCPHVVKKLPLLEIASYLRVTPTTISKIRKGLSEENKSFEE